MNRRIDNRRVGHMNERAIDEKRGVQRRERVAIGAGHVCQMGVKIRLKTDPTYVAGRFGQRAARLSTRTPAGSRPISEAAATKRPLTNTSVAADRRRHSNGARSSGPNNDVTVTRQGEATVDDRRDAREPPLLVARRRKPERLEARERLARMCQPLWIGSTPARADALGFGHVQIQDDGISTPCRNSRFWLDPAVALLFELERQLLAARPDDAAVRQHVDDVGHDVVEQTLVVGDEQHRAIGAAHRC